MSLCPVHPNALVNPGTSNTGRYPSMDTPLLGSCEVFYPGAMLETAMVRNREKHCGGLNQPGLLFPEGDNSDLGSDPGKCPLQSPQSSPAQQGLFGGGSQRWAEQGSNQGQPGVAWNMTDECSNKLEQSRRERAGALANNWTSLGIFQKQGRLGVTDKAPGVIQHMIDN